MDIEVSGKIIQLPIKSLGHPIDGFLKTLFTGFFVDFSKPYLEFIKTYYLELQTNVNSYFDGKINDPPGQDYLFNNLTVIWNTYQINGRIYEAQQFWQDILNIVTQWEDSRKARIHKGSLFYFWSQSAIIQGQLDKGFFLIHSAYEEDVLTCKTERPPTPTTLTLSLNNLDKGNFLYPLADSWAKYLNQFITNYQVFYSRKFNIDDFRTKFLNKPPNRDTLFSFTYTLARFFDLDTYSSIIVQSTFASIFELNSLFDLVLVIDTTIYSSIKTPGKDDWKFRNLANYLLIQSGLSVDPKINNAHLDYINIAKDNDFENTLAELLDHKFVYEDGTSPTKPECDIALAYCLRNYSAHTLSSYPIIAKRFLQIRQIIFNVLFFATETLL